MWRLAQASLMLVLLTSSTMLVAGQAFSATIFMQSHIFFEKSLGISNDSDVSYGRINPSANERLSITPHGEISSENGGIVHASEKSHPGRIIIDDGRSQQFGLIASHYKASGNIRPLKAYCAFDRNLNLPCNRVKSFKGPEAKTLFVGMDIQVLGFLDSQTVKELPSFDLSVVYF